MGANIHMKYIVFHKATKKCVGTAEILKGWENIVFKSGAVELLSQESMKIVKKPKSSKTKNTMDEQGEFVEDIINHIKEPLLPTQDDEENMDDSTDPLNGDDNMSARLEEEQLEQMLFNLQAHTSTKVEEMEVKVDPSSIKMEPTEETEDKNEKWRETGQSLISQYCDKILPYCQKCKGTFPSLQENLDHWRKIHPEEPVQFFCRFQDCDYVSDSNIDGMKNHIKEHLVGSGKIIYCPVCDKPQVKKSLAKHVSNCLQERTNPTANSKTINSEMLDQMASVGETISDSWRGQNIPVGLYVKSVLRFCSKCDKLFPKYDDVVIHWLKDHSDEKMKFNCKFSGCKHILKNDEEMKDHILDHRVKAGLSVKCPFCDKTFAKIKYIEEHVQYMHSGLPLEETKIGRERERQLQANIKCPTCDKTFSTEQAKEKHIRNIHLRTSFKCKLCDATFPKKGDMIVHIKREHSDVDKPYNCHICEKSFRTQVLLKGHMNSHEEKQVVCDDCGKSFKSKHYLTCHVNDVHKKILKFSCDQCDFKCTRSDILSRHMIDHTGIYPFNCSTCGKGFKSGAELKKHEDKHLPDDLKYKFTCQYCGSMFTRKVNMEVHIKSHHLNKT